MSRTLAEQEFTARYDREEKILWLGTTIVNVATRWRRAGYPVRVLGTIAGIESSWELQLPSTVGRTEWLRAIRMGITRWPMDAVSCSPDAIQTTSPDDDLADEGED